MTTPPAGRRMRIVAKPCSAAVCEPIFRFRCTVMLFHQKSASCSRPWSNWRRNVRVSRKVQFSNTKAKILLDLDDTQAILATFRLNRKNVVSASTVHAYVNLIALNLANAGNRGSKVVLQGVARNAGE